MQIGPYKLPNNLILAPMAGVTDRAFRDICRRFGADMGFCEFASASGLTYGGEATWRLVDTEGEEGLVGIQIFGADVDGLVTEMESLRVALDETRGTAGGDRGRVEVVGPRRPARLERRERLGRNSRPLITSRADVRLPA